MSVKQPFIAHGVLMSVFSQGVLFLGESGSGKSDLTLELLFRGHSLVADDAVVLTPLAGGGLRGSCPEALRGLLEVRGVGLVDVVRLCGREAFKPDCTVDAVIELVRARTPHAYIENRLDTRLQTFSVLNCIIPKLCLPINETRPIVALVETAVKQWPYLVKDGALHKTSLQ